MGITGSKKIVAIIFVSVCLWAGNSLVAGHAAEAAETAEPVHYVHVYYFHGKVRCHSCNIIEKLTLETVRDFFPEELEKGRLKLSVVNVSDGENEHFVQEYSLYSQSVILSEMKDGKEVSWKNLIRVWELVQSEEKFKEYVQGEVKAYLEKTGKAYE